MDTLLIRRSEFEISNRILDFIFAILILSILLFSQIMVRNPIYANDIVANAFISTPALFEKTKQVKDYFNPEIQKEKFELRISNKYSGLKVNSVADGIKHIKMTKYYAGKPVKINIVEINQKIAKDYEVKPAIASDKSLHHKNTLKTIAKRTNSIAAINGGFFKPQTGVPLGTLMIDGKIYTGPIYNRAALGIFDNGYEAGRVEFSGIIKSKNVEIKIDNINQPRMLSSYVLAYTRDWGEYAPVSPRYGVQLQIKGDKILAASANPLSIPDDGYVIVGPKSILGQLFGAEKVNIKIETNPKWQNVKHIISGGPFLVKNGEVYVDMTAEKLQAIGGRNPRSAIGYTADNDLILVAVDGREGSSIGMTLNELASLMKSLGCVNAINLDGGGSTVMYIDGKIVNNPRQSGGIALSNAIVISKKNLNLF